MDGVKNNKQWCRRTGNIVFFFISQILLPCWNIVLTLPTANSSIRYLGGVSCYRSLERCGVLTPFSRHTHRFVQFQTCSLNLVFSGFTQFPLEPQKKILFTVVFIDAIELYGSKMCCKCCSERRGQEGKMNFSLLWCSHTQLCSTSL